MNLASLFGGSNPVVQTPAVAAEVAPAPNTAGNLSPAPIAADPDNAAAPAALPKTAEEIRNSGLDQYKELWDTPPIVEGAAPNMPAPLDAGKLQELVAKASFTNAITPEILASVAAGGEEAQAAFTSALNSVAQDVMVQSTLAGNKMLDQRMDAMQASQAAAIAEAIRTQTSANSLVDSNPVFSNPAVKPVIEAVQAQLALKHPNASPTELTSMAQNFVTTMSESLNPKQPDPSLQDASGQDWTKFIT